MTPKLQDLSGAQLVGAVLAMLVIVAGVFTLDVFAVQSYWNWFVVGTIDAATPAPFWQTAGMVAVGLAIKSILMPPSVVKEDYDFWQMVLTPAVFLLLGLVVHTIFF